MLNLVKWYLLKLIFTSSGTFKHKSHFILKGRFPVLITIVKKL